MAHESLPHGPEIDWSRVAVEPLVVQLRGLLTAMEGLEQQAASRLAAIPERNRASAINLLHYVALRRHDLRSLQDGLRARGLSSLGRCEANVQATIATVIDVLCRLSGADRPAFGTLHGPGFEAGQTLLARSGAGLFGDRPVQGDLHIMVTMPTEAANDGGQLIRALVARGMDCMRVNCAHDDMAVWEQMIGHLHRATAEMGRNCRVLMDLGGPKVRTGPIVPGPAVIRCRPKRDDLGRVVVPGRFWLSTRGAGVKLPPADAVVPIDAATPSQFESIRPGDVLTVRDTRGRFRRISVVDRLPGAIRCETVSTVYFAPGLEVRRAVAHSARETVGRIGSILPREARLLLKRGDRLILGNEHVVGSPAVCDEAGGVLAPDRIGCTLSSVFSDLRVDQRVLLDDGKIGCVVREVHPDEAVLEVVAVPPEGAVLRSDKGINLPDTELRLDALTDKDRDDLAFVARAADIVGYSFVRRPRDVRKLRAELARHGRPDLPIVLKIENRQAFERLPSLLLAALEGETSGVMIARGDLAVELGWRRLAEVQEEILWMCEAAHLPVIWATQVLEGLAKTGLPSRAEITDAAMSVRAECVMLNKGPHILEAVGVLADILERMRDHQAKKRPLLRRLHLADDALLESE